MQMKTIVKFKALVKTRVRDENGKKIAVAKDRNFTTTPEFAKSYRSYKRLFLEVEIIVVDEPKLDKNKAKNSNAFPVTISEDMPNAEIEKILTEMGAKFKKKGSKKDLMKAFNERQVEIEEENKQKFIEKETEVFCKMVDNRTIDQLQEFVEDMDKALEIENIDKEICEEHITETLAKRIEEKEALENGDEDDNSEGSLDGKGSEGSLKGADAGEVKNKKNNKKNKKK